MVLALGLGADGVCPYVMVEVICVDDYETDVSNLCAALRKGIEKVISTIGIHEVRGYARQFSSIGVKPELAEIFQTEAFCGLREGRRRLRRPRRRQPTSAPRILAGEEEAKPAKTFRFYPKVYKAAIAAANGTGTLRGVLGEGARARARSSPISMRHIMGLKGDREPIDPAAGRRRRRPPRLPDRDLLDELRLAGASPPSAPTPRRRSAINILCINGEGGEIRDMYGKYPQVARPAGRLGPLRRLGGDAQLLLPGRDQDRPGRQARRGRPPARQEGLREGRRRP